MSTAELESLIGADQLSRPAYPLAADGTAGRRDPSPTWDPWYCLSLARRRRLVRHMAPAGDPGGLALDQLAQVIGAGSLEQALERWAQCCEMARSSQTARADVDDWQAAAEQAESDAELYGPQELALRWDCTVAALHQRRHRGRTPAPDLTISGVPIWTGETLRVFEEWTMTQ